MPGSLEQLDMRDQSPTGVFGAPTLGLRDGRYPAGAGEVALTRSAACRRWAMIRNAAPASRPTRVIATTVWGGGEDEHVIEATVSRLRTRLGPVGSALRTVPRRGYLFDATPIASAPEPEPAG